MIKHSEPNKRYQPRRFDVHQTLPNTSYQPGTATRTRPPEIIRGTAGQAKPKRERSFGFKKAFLILFVALLTPLLVIAAWDLRNASAASEKLFGSGDMTGLLTPTILNSSSDRVNILLVGYSVDDPGHAGAALTDSIMVVSLNKADNTGYMLSVPRDLYVDIPDYGNAKINEAFQAGEQADFKESGYPSGGAGLLQKVISENFGVPLHYYVLVDYSTVRDIVDALDGITVNIKSPDPDGLYDPNFKPEEGGPLKLANGPQKIDGQTALRLTRARGATYGSYGFPQSDINRIQNQQLVFAAIKNEMDWRLILDPRLNGRIFDAIASNVKTDLELREVLPLFRLFNSVPDDSLKPINLRDIGKVDYLSSYRTPRGQSALVPAAGRTDFTEIQAIITQLSQ